MRRVQADRNLSIFTSAKRKQHKIAHNNEKDIYSYDDSHDDAGFDSLPAASGEGPRHRHDGHGPDSIPGRRFLPVCQRRLDQEESPETRVRPLRLVRRAAGEQCGAPQRPLRRDGQDDSRGRYRGPEDRGPVQAGTRLGQAQRRGRTAAPEISRRHLCRQGQKSPGNGAG